MTNQVITFDDLAAPSSDGMPIPNGYSGLNWSNFYVANSSQSSMVNSGYRYGTITSPNVAYNAYGSDASFSAPADQSFPE